MVEIEHRNREENGGDIPGAHTPGPWMVSKFSSTSVVNEAGRSIASCGGYSNNHDEGAHVFENEANARLIAAAPDTAAQRDNLLETVRGIAAMPESDGSRMKLWATDSLSGFTEPVEASLLKAYDERDRLKESNAELLGALKEIAKGEGPFFRDQLKHAESTIDSMKEIARAAIERAKQ